MPELPEVETVVRGLRPDLLGAVAQEVWTDWERVLDGRSVEEFNRELCGRTILALDRRGKYICLRLDTRYLVVHLRMTGRLYLSWRQRGDDAWVHFSLRLLDGRFLVFSDARKFGRVTLTSSLDFLERKLGPEPLSLTHAGFRDLFGESRRAIKVFLLDQKNIAGIGNIYADEALFTARIHPETPVQALKPRQKTRLVKAIQEVLERGIRHEGASINWYRKPDGSKGESQVHFFVYGRKDAPCLDCGTPVRRIVLGQRGTHFCPKCQVPRA